jgi:uncharacterized protein (DUF433 family)
MSSFTLLGRGLYSLPEAEWLSGVPRGRIRRWMQGYSYRYKGESRRTTPAIASDLPDLGVGLVVAFADLLEVRFLDAFLKYGVGWRAIRIAAQRAKEMLGRHHPFSSRIFKTDGRTIMAELVGEFGDRHLLDLVRDQWQFEQVVAPYLYAGVDYNEMSEPERWWPLGEERHVVIDPAVILGAPVVAGIGVPTRIVANAVKAEGSTDLVARLFDVEVAAVEDALSFELQRPM